MTNSEKKVAEINVAYAVVREWQRGAISALQLNYRLGDYLTQVQIEALTPHLHRTIGKGQLAQRIAEVIGL